MNGISHQQAIQFIHQRLDGILHEDQQSLLDEHMDSCESCQAYASEMELLPDRLQHEFHARWDQNEGPSKNMLARIEKQRQRVMMSSRVSFVFRAVASIVAVLLVGLLINTVVSQMSDQAVTLTETSNGSESVSSQPDDRLLLFTMEMNGNLDIYTMRVDGSELTNLTNNPAQDVSPVWSPDGRKIFFSSERNGNMDIFSMDSDGSQLSQLTDNPGYDGFSSLSPTGEKVIYISSESNHSNVASLVIMNVDGSSKLKLTEPGSYIFLDWSPDGQKIVYLEQVSEQPQDDEIHVSNANGKNHYHWTAIIDEIHWEDEGHFVGHGWSGQHEPPTWNIYRFSTDGTPPVKIVSYRWPIVALNDHTYVVEGSTSLDWYAFDGDSTPMKSWNIHGTCKQGGDPSFLEDTSTISPDGTRVFITAYCVIGYHQFYLANVDGSELKLFTDFSVGTYVDERGVWSPDGKYVLTPITNRLDVTVDFYLFDIEKITQDPSAQPVQITTDGNTKYGIAWQPLSNDGIVEETTIPEPTQVSESQNFPTIGTNISNGEWIAFIGGKTIPDPVNSTAMTTEQDVFLIHPDGSGLVNITNSPNFYFSPQWSPNGNNLLFLKGNNNVDILRKTEPVGFEVLVNTQVSFDVPFEYSWSPNNERIAFVDHRAGNYDIYTVYADGRNDPELAQLTNDPAQDVGFAWSPDGSQIAFQRLNDDQLSVYVMNEDGSDQHEVARGTGKVTLYWSRDGKTIYVSSMEGNWLECKGCVHEPGIYRIDLESPSVQQIYYEAESNQVGWYLYDTPQNTLYFMRTEPQPFLELWGTWFRADGNSVQQLNKFDAYQTCETTDGNILSEDISPNPGFSIISNYCAGGFDLYLADREAAEPELLHLLRLPLDTWGQGGDNATLPIQWSPDGRWIVYDNGNGSMLLLDLEKVMQDPDTQPVPLIQPILFEEQSGQLFQSPETISVFDLVWQPNR